MTNKKKTGLTRSENGVKYFGMKKEANKPISDLFNQPRESENDKIFRHLDLGTITLHFYNKMTKKEVTEIDITTPFILNAKCYDSNTGQFKNNNQVSKIIRGHLLCNYEQNMDQLGTICKAKGLEDEFKFFEEQFLKYKKRDDSWYISSNEPNTAPVPYVEFFTAMDKRYKNRTGKTFNLNPYALTYLRILINQDYYTNTPMPARTTVTIDDLAVILYQHKAKLHIKPIPKPSKLRKLFGTLFKWSGLEVDHDKLDIDTFDEAFGSGQKEQSYRLNYEILPKIHSDYSRLAEIKLDTISCELWVELFKLNNHIPPFLVPLDAEEFTSEQLKEIVEHVPRIIIDWELPELYHVGLPISLKTVYPHLTVAQQEDPFVISHFNKDDRALVPANVKQIDKIAHEVSSNPSMLGNIYDLLDERLRLKHWKEVRGSDNLSFIPDHSKVENEFMLLLCKTTYESSWGAHRNLVFGEMHPILQKNPHKLFECLVALNESKFAEVHALHEGWALDDIESLSLHDFNNVENHFSTQEWQALNDSGMLSDDILTIDDESIKNFNRALQFQQLQAKIQVKPDIPKKKNKI